MRAIGVVLLLFALIVPAAHAEDSTVAVLPWTASSKDLSVYGELVAKGIAKRLGKGTSFRLQMVTGKARVPDKVALVIDGRILGAGDRVVLEARIRDPELGQAMAVHKTRAAPLADLENLATELAAALGPALERAVVQKRATAKAIAIAPVRKTADPESAPAEKKASRPSMVVVRVAGRAADGAIPVTGPATLASVELARRLGFDAVPVADRGLLTGERARQLAATHKADYALVLYVGEIGFSWKRVLTARGRLRVALLSAKGEIVFDRWVVTDTLVGSRGDRHAALVYFVAEQAALIAQPLLAKKIR